MEEREVYCLRSELEAAVSQISKITLENLGKKFILQEDWSKLLGLLRSALCAAEVALGFLNQIFGVDAGGENAQISKHQDARKPPIETDDGVKLEENPLIVIELLTEDAVQGEYEGMEGTEGAVDAADERQDQEEDRGIHSDAEDDEYISGQDLEEYIIKCEDKSHRKRPFICETCEKSFSNKHLLQRHQLFHKGEKPYKCETCEKSFTLKSHLKRHKMIHTGEKPHSCDICNRSFSEKGDLKKHKKIHTDRIKMHQCEICSKYFIDKTVLKTHLNTIHSGIKHQCEICNKSYTEKGSLTRHKRIHTGEKPFKCDVCDKTFTDRSNLAQHMNKHCVLTVA